MKVLITSLTAESASTAPPASASRNRNPSAARSANRGLTPTEVRAKPSRRTPANQGSTAAGRSPTRAKVSASAPMSDNVSLTSKMTTAGFPVGPCPVPSGPFMRSSSPLGQVPLVSLHR
jgi:hypothetical protein